VADLKAGLYTYCSTHPVLSALIDNRIYPQLAPPNAAHPYLTYQRLGFERTAHLAGRSALIRSALQLDVWGVSSEQVETVFLALEDALDGYQGPMGAVAVRLVRFTSVLDDLEEPSETRQTGIWRSVIQADIWYADSG
jgi:hypothetical protein